MKLYHLSLDALNIIKEFEVKVPSTASVTENKEDKRVCLSDSIDNCLNSIVWTQNQRIKNIFTKYSNYRKSIPIRVYEFEIEDSSNNIVKPEDVHKSGVLDAREFEEYWYTGEEPLVPNKTYTIQLINDYEKEEVQVFEYYGTDDYELDDVLTMKDSDEMWEILDCHFKYAYFWKISNIQYEVCNDFFEPDYSYRAFDGHTSHYSFEVNKKVSASDVEKVIYSLLSTDEDLTEDMVEVNEVSDNKFNITTYNGSNTFLKRDIVDAFNNLGVAVAI